MGSFMSRPTTKVNTSGRLEAGDFTLQDAGKINGKGLGVLTAAIHASEDRIAEAGEIASIFKSHTGQDIEIANYQQQKQNQIFAATIRDIWITKGWLAAYENLWNAVPRVSTHPRLLEDMKIAVDIYSRLQPGEPKKKLTDLKIHIGSEVTYDDIHWVGPKSAGGKAWKSSKEYLEVLQRPGWKDSQDSKGLSPCITYGWLGVATKMVPEEHFQKMAIMNLLGTVDYDLDEISYTKGGFKTGFDMAAKYAIEPQGEFQIAAFAGLISHDFQTFVRPIQNQWVKEKRGSTNLGPRDIKPSDWSALLIADCAALVPFGFEPIEDYNRSRVGVTAGMLHQTCHDLLFDTGCSNRINSVQYSDAAGIAKYGIHAAFANGFIEAMAKTFVDSLPDSPEKPKPYFGYNAHLVVGAWNGFNTRYRPWERTIKYTRQLVASQSVESKSLLDLSRADLILRDCDLTRDVGDSWTRATKSTSADLIPRNTESYFIPSRVSDLLKTPGTTPPTLCVKCGPTFSAILSNNSMEEVHAVAGLPDYVTSCRAASLAVGLRRVSLWALSPKCCESCACRIGFWADAVGYSVLTALLADEPTTGNSTWCLQNYFVAAITYWPINLPFLLSGFDILADVIPVEGAMGVRDVVDI